MRTLLPKAVGIAPRSTSTSSALPKRSRPSSGRKVKPDKCAECVKHKKKCEFLFGSSSCHQCTVKRKECHKRSLTDAQRERVRDPKRRRLDSGPTNDEEPERETLSPYFVPGVLPQMSSRATSPSLEFSGNINGFDQSEFLSPAPSSTSSETSFEMQVQQLKDQLLRNPGSRDTAVRLMELLQTRLSVDELVEFWKDLVLKTVRVRIAAAEILSLVFERKGDLEEALGFWKDLVQQHPERIQYAEQLTNTFESMGNVAGAIDFWESTVQTVRRPSKRLDIAHSELAKCEVDGDPVFCTDMLNAIRTYPLRSRCPYNIGKVMSRADRVHKAIQMYELLKYKHRFMAGFCEGATHSSTVVELIKGMPGNEFTDKFLAFVYSDGAERPDALQFWREQLMKNPTDHHNISKLAEALQRNGDLDAAIDLCKGCDGWRVKDQLSWLLKLKGGDAEFEYWSPHAGRTHLSERGVECLTSAFLLANNHEAIVELCHVQLSNFRSYYHYYYLIPVVCFAVQKTVTKEGDWGCAIRIWEALIAKHPQHQKAVGYALVEALLESTQIDRALEVCDLVLFLPLKSWKKVTNSLIASRGISSALEFWENRILTKSSGNAGPFVYEVERIFKLRNDRPEDLRFWKRLSLDNRFMAATHISFIHPLTRAFAMDYEGLIEFWRERSRSGDAIFREWRSVRTLRRAITSKRDIDFETTFWTTLFNCNPKDRRVTRALVATLSGSNPDQALESYQRLLARSGLSYPLAQEVDRIFKKKGDIQGEVEFWKTVVWGQPGIGGFRNRLMRLFKQSGDVDQAVKFWTEMLSRAERVGLQLRLRQKLSEAKKWKEEVEAALTFRGLASGE